MDRNRIIQICDDDADLRGALRRLLSSRYTVTEASGGREALKLIAERCPDVVLLDIGLPGLGGLQVLRAYRQTHPALRTIVISGFHDSAIAQRALSLGARVYLTKPFDPAILLEEIRCLLEPADQQGRMMRSPWRLGSKPVDPDDPGIP